MNYERLPKLKSQYDPNNLFRLAGQPMQLNAALCRNAALFFLTFFVLVVWAFWPSYYSHPLMLPSATHDIHASR